MSQQSSPLMGSKTAQPAWLVKLIGVLESRKFWALVVAIGLSAFAYRTGEVGAQEALIAAISSLAIYILGTAIEDGMARSSK